MKGHPQERHWSQLTETLHDGGQLVPTWTMGKIGQNKDLYRDDDRIQVCWDTQTNVQSPHAEMQ